MSNQPPNRPPFTPLHPRVPELARDSEGNVLYRDTDGSWRRHNGQTQQNLLGQMHGQTQEPMRPSEHSSLHDKSRGGPDSPIEHAFQDQYQFALRPIPSNATQHPIPIDPALIALPGGADLDLRDGPTIAHARGLKPAEKVAGSRRKGKERADPKGKKRQRASSGSEDDSEPPAKRGRPAGAGNYSRDDTSKLFDLIEEELPVGQKGWKVIHRRYNKWALLNSRPKRSPKSLESKYKQYLKLKKPTGSATCPPEVKRAHELEDLINIRVGTRDLSDSEFDDESGGGSSNDDDIQVVDHPSGALRTAVARRAPTPPLRRNARASGADLANKLAHVFDPDVQKARDDARSQRALENTQILTLSQQLRDAQAVAEGLRAQITILQNRVHDVERARDRAELRLEVLQMAKGREQARGRSRHREYRRRSHKNMPGIQRVRGKVRCEETYPDGGAQTYWISDPSTSEDDNEENHDPWDGFEVDGRTRSHYASSRRALSRRRTPTPGPSRIRQPSPPSFLGRQLSISPARPTSTLPAAPSSTVTGNAVELVVTPRRGSAIAFVISPAPKNTHSNAN